MKLSKNRKRFFLIPTIGLVSQTCDDGCAILIILFWLHYALVVKWFDILKDKEGQK